MAMDINTQGLEHLTAAYSSQSYKPAYVQTLSQKEMQERSLPKLLAQKGLELVNMVMGAGVSEAYGQESKQYNTVDEILDDTPFQKVSLKDYERMVSQHKKVVGLLYEDGGADSINGWNAKLFQATANEYPDITFLAVKYNPNISQSEYMRLGFKGTPHYLFYVDGKSIFSNPGGSKMGKGFSEDIEKMKRNLNKFNDI